VKQGLPRELSKADPGKVKNFPQALKRPSQLISNSIYGTPQQLFKEQKITVNFITTVWFGYWRSSVIQWLKKKKPRPKPVSF
jgi:hypothetical protein